MGIVLLLAGVALVVLPAACAKLGVRLHPAEWARLCVAALCVGWVTIETAALLYAAPAVLALVADPRLAATCRRMLHQFAPGGLPASAAATVVAVALPVLGVRALRRARRVHRSLHVEDTVGAHTNVAGYDLVVLPTQEPIALSVGGRKPQILISDGLRDALSPAQLDLVLKHEIAHLAHRHQAYLSVAQVMDVSLAVVPTVRASSAQLRLALERWADEAAAGSPAPRRLALRSALAAAAGGGHVESVAAFSTLDTLLARLDALARPTVVPSQPQRFAAYLPGGVLSAVLVAGGFAWGHQAAMVATMVGHCVS